MLAGIDVTIERSTVEMTLVSEISFSRGFPDDFPSASTNEMGESSGINFLFLVIAYHLILRDCTFSDDNLMWLIFQVFKKNM